MAQPEGEDAGAPVILDQGEGEEDIHDRTTVSIGHPRTPASAPHSTGRGGHTGYEGEEHPILVSSDLLYNAWQDLVQWARENVDESTCCAVGTDLIRRYPDRVLRYLISR
jgi:hypothetical protein